MLELVGNMLTFDTIDDSWLGMRRRLGFAVGWMLGAALGNRVGERNRSSTE